MLLGQLFYFEKELSKLSSNLVVADFLNIEIAGVPKSSLVELQNTLALDEFSIKLKELFIGNYFDLLEQNQLFTAINFWKSLTSPIKEKLSLLPKSEFQNQLLDWIYNDGEIKNIQDKVLNTGRYSHNQEDFALYYGLHVLQLIYLVSTNDLAYSGQVLNLPKIDKIVADFVANPEIIIISSNSIKPLISNLNCIFLNNDQSKNVIVDQVSQNLDLFETLKLIIIDTQDIEIVIAIKKANSKKALLVELNFSSDQEDNFFDVLVKQTLGINLN